MASTRPVQLPVVYDTPPAGPEKSPAAHVESMSRLPPASSPKSKNVELRFALQDSRRKGTTIASEEQANTVLAALKQAPPIESLHLECVVTADLTSLIVEAAAMPTLKQLSVCECSMDAEECMSALRSAPALRELAWRAYATDEAVFELVRNGSALTTLRLSPYQESALTSEAVLAIASFCPELCCLDLAGASAASSAGASIGDEAVRLLSGAVEGVSGCATLAQLNLGGARLTDASLQLLAEGT